MVICGFYLAGTWTCCLQFPRCNAAVRCPKHFHQRSDARKSDNEHQHPKTRPFCGHKQLTFFSRRASQQSCVRPGALPIFNQLRNVSQSCSYHSLPGTLGILEPSGVSSMSQCGCIASNKTQSCLGNFSTTNQHEKAKTCMVFDSFGRARLQFWFRISFSSAHGSENSSTNLRDLTDLTDLTPRSGQAQEVFHSKVSKVSTEFAEQKAMSVTDRPLIFETCSHLQLCL